MILTGNEQAAEAAAYLSAVLDGSPDAIILCGLDGTVLDWNPGAEKLYGYPAREAEGRKVAFLAPFDRLEEAATTLSAVAAGQSVPPFETVQVQKGGHRVEVEVAFRAVRTGASTPAAAVMIVRSLADQRRLEGQLRQAHKMECMGRLAGGIAHDFNNLLTIINGYGQMALDDLPHEDSGRGNIEEILRAAGRAANLAHQILSFSRKQALQHRPVDLNHVIAGMEKMLRRLLPDDVELRIDLAPAAWVEVDTGQLEQVILNLVVNACDAMPDGGRVSIETAVAESCDPACEQDAASGRCIRLSVSDNGRGIDPETQLRLFEPFFTTKQPGKGTGLGLSTVHDIVEKAGGRIWVDSQPGRGAHFRICLPRVEARVDPDTARRAAGATCGRETVLLVEDEPDVRKLIRGILIRHGYSVLEAGGGKEAIRICEVCPATIPVMLTDVVMRDMSGPELVDRLSPIRPLMSVIYMSGYPDESLLRHGVVNCGHFLRKPFKPEALASKLREVLDRAAEAGLSTWPVSDGPGAELSGRAAT
jgi:PAS domain S-box-containing protein